MNGKSRFAPSEASGQQFDFIYRVLLIVRLRPCRRPPYFGLLFFGCFFVVMSVLHFVLDRWWPHIVVVSLVLEVTVISEQDGVSFYTKHV